MKLVARIRPEAPAPALARKDLEKIALVSLRTARLLMESGACAEIMARCARNIATGLGATLHGFRVGYASLAISLGEGDHHMITRMIAVGRHGVNYRMDCAVRSLAKRVAAGGMTCGEVDAELDAIAAHTPRHAPIFVACAVGLACAAFGRLLGIDWLAFGPTFAASSCGQYLRHVMHKRRFNPCVIAAAVAFFNAIVSGYGARLLGSGTLSLAMIASILLLVPGVPATNAQTDIMDGHPTTGSARAVFVIMIMIFATTGVWLAALALGIEP